MGDLLHREVGDVQMRGISLLGLSGLTAALGMDLGMRKDVLSRVEVQKGVQRLAGRAPQRSRTTLRATNGKRECERRQRQIAAGSLKAANGLVNVA